MASTLTLHPPLPSTLHRSNHRKSTLSPIPSLRNPNPNPRFSPIAAFASASDPSSSSSWEREEIRWLREEQRWLREEQRWIREESRWRAERDALLREIAALRLQIDTLERQRLPIEVSIRAPPPPGVTGGGSTRRVLAEESEVKEVVKEEKVRASEEKKKKRKTLRMGAEGEDVRAMQEALLRLGFYSGEEDMEFSSFSTGTDRAVKTWQSTLGTSEDGVMTSELLERLFMERGTGDSSSKENANKKSDSVNDTEKDGLNGTPVASVTQIQEIQQTVIKETGKVEVEVSEHRVFLLGENRWEEPSRLKGRDKPIGRTKAVSSTKCLACRGEGRLMCAECDGSGEPNIEPQFLEWIDEGTKCPYCEGLGYTICDVCEGKTTVS